MRAPAELPDSVARHIAQVRGLYDQWSPVFLRCAGATHQTVLLPVGPSPAATNREMARRAGFDRARRLLDAGCGVGGPACDVAAACPSLVVDAVTVSPVQAELAADVVAARGLAERVRIHRADYHRLPFAAGSFDAAWLLESACYSPRPAALLAELARVMASGATLYIKDLFLRDGRLDEAARRDLLRLRRLWALPRLWPIDRWVRWADRVGFAVRDASELSDANNDWYTGAMFEFGANGFSLNEFGQHFAVSTPAAPIVWRQLVATRR